MKSFKQFVNEATVDDFISKVTSCQTIDGIKELEKYYSTRGKEVEVSHSDDIYVRDAINGRKLELEAATQQPEEDKF